MKKKVVKKVVAKKITKKTLRFPKKRLDVETPPKLRDAMVDALCSIKDPITQITVSKQAHSLICALLVVGQQDVTISRTILKTLTQMLDSDIRKFAKYETKTA